MLTFSVVLWRNNKLEKLPKLEISGGSGWENLDSWSERDYMRLANHIQGFRIPCRWEAGEKKNKGDIDFRRLYS